MNNLNPFNNFDVNILNKAYPNLDPKNHGKLGYVNGRVTLIDDLGDKLKFQEIVVLIGGIKSRLTPFEKPLVVHTLRYMAYMKQKHAYGFKNFLGSNFLFLRQIFSLLQNAFHHLGFQTSVSMALKLADEIERSQEVSQPMPAQNPPINIKKTPDNLIFNLNDQDDTLSNESDNLSSTSESSKDECQKSYQDYESSDYESDIYYDQELSDILELKDIESDNSCESDEIDSESDESYIDVNNLQSDFRLLNDVELIAKATEILNDIFYEFKLDNCQIIPDIPLNSYFSKCTSDSLWQNNDGIYKEICVILKQPNFYGLDSNQQRLLLECITKQYEFDRLRTSLRNASFQMIVPVPPDGNCFLWSLVIGQYLENHPEHQQRVSRLSKNPKLNCQLITLKDNLRAQVLNEFDKLFADTQNQQGIQNFVVNLQENEAEFSGFLKYSKDDIKEMGLTKKMPEHIYDSFYDVENDLDTPAKIAQIILDNFDNQVVQDIICLKEADYENLFKTLKIPRHIIEGYRNRLMTNGVWNGSFEIELTSRILKRPIFVMVGNGNTNLKCMDSAGNQFMDKQPLFVRFSHGGHYDWIKG
ncbi:MAG: hypothetical protein JHC93_05085 [Parachlamydiales bacterium]|nr:hypothetical protein [Parachlamydiales bacterium]